MTKRETEILALLKQGQRAKEIAFHLQLSIFTVYGYLAVMRKVYRVKTTPELLTVQILS